MTAIIVNPSILAADQLSLASEVRSAEQSGAEWIHIDVMDGHFVPNLTFGIPLIESLRGKTKAKIDTHLMITNPDETALDYVRAGSDLVSFHVEAARHAHRLLGAIRDGGALAGLAINPGTALECLWPLLGHVDLINVMSVNPGFGGQKFIESAIERVRAIATKLKSAGLDGKVKIEVDGGVNLENATRLFNAGAGVFVTGNYFYKSSDRAHAVSQILSLAKSGR